MADQRFVEHDADAIPIAGGREGFPQGLLGGHVAGRADDRAVRIDGSSQRPTQILGHTEIEQNHAALGRDQHVRGLDVAMQLAPRVQGLQPLYELS